jgi:hypothetical protein
MPKNVLARVNTDPADSCAVNLNARFHFRLFARLSLQELVRVVDRARKHHPAATGEPCIV